MINLLEMSRADIGALEYACVDALRHGRTRVAFGVDTYDFYTIRTAPAEAVLVTRVLTAISQYTSAGGRPL